MCHFTATGIWKHLITTVLNTDIFISSERNEFVFW